jgi:hypothetical protein
MLQIFWNVLLRYTQISFYEISDSDQFWGPRSLPSNR